MTHVIQTHNLSRSYGRTDALHGLDLTIPQNAIYALVGPNGAGKTTVIKLLMNILRPPPAAHRSSATPPPMSPARPSLTSAMSPKIRSCPSG